MIHPPFRSNRTNWGTDFIAPQSLGGVRRIFVGPTLLDWTLDMRRSASVSSSSKQWSLDAVMLDQLEQMSSGARGVVAPCFDASAPSLPAWPAVCGHRCSAAPVNTARANRALSERWHLSGSQALSERQPLSKRQALSRQRPVSRARRSIQCCSPASERFDIRLSGLFDVELQRGFESKPRQLARRQAVNRS